MKKLIFIWLLLLTVTSICKGQKPLITNAANHRVFANSVNRNIAGWHTDTAKVTVLFNDSTFEQGAYRVTTYYRNKKGVLLNSCSNLFKSNWQAIKPEDVYDVR